MGKRGGGRRGRRGRGGGGGGGGGGRRNELVSQSTALCTVHVVMQTTSTQEVTATVDRIKQLLHRSVGKGAGQVLTWHGTATTFIRARYRQRSSPCARARLLVHTFLPPQDVRGDI
eukprot:288830-Hanusia_phi.AAC.3